MSRQQQRVAYKNMGRTQAYVDGNTVRKLDTMPQMQPQEERQREQQRRVKTRTRVQQKQAVQMGFGYAVFLTVVVALIGAVGAFYIQLQADNNKRMSHITSVEGQILEMQITNDAAVKKIESSINLEEVKNIAIKEMGMVYPSQEQIEYLPVDVDDYMNQYQDIPEK